MEQSTTEASPDEERIVGALVGRASGGPEVAALIVQLVVSARAIHPDVSTDLGDFVGKILARGDLDEERLLRLRASDLWLACACARGDRRALELFDELFGGEFDVVFGRARVHGVDRDDFRQASREKLFAISRPGGSIAAAPKIADYSGEGDLRNWLRVMLTRTLLDLARKRRETPVEEAPAEIPAPTGDPEIDYMKARYREAFRSAFEVAARGLEPEDRNLLRQHFAQGLGIDRLAALHRIHRATAARRITRARDLLLARTRAELRARLGVRDVELDSVMRVLGGEVEVTVERVLGATLEA
jgi:RNA polymerase sigma-70 factor (ECF subfamily)